jgi:alkaline phosphatase D
VPAYASFVATTPLLGIWDDHDYGRNDGGQEYPETLKYASKTALLDFLGTPADSPRRQRPGIYDARICGPVGQRVQILLLDGRWFRALPGSHAAYLGADQWAWLEEQLRQPAELRIVCSGIQVVAEGHPYEGWIRFPAERDRLLHLLRRSGPSVILSGDRHIGELSGWNHDGGLIPDLTSSGLTHPWTKGDRIPNPRRIGKAVTVIHAGLLDIDWSTRRIALALMDERGLRILEQAYAFTDLAR